MLCLVLPVFYGEIGGVPRRLTEADCGDCVPETCAPLPQEGCASVHTVTDECGCCPMCVDVTNSTTASLPAGPGFHIIECQICLAAANCLQK